MAGRPHRRRGLPDYEIRAGWWHDQILAAGTPQEQYRQAVRFLHATAARARRAGLGADADQAFHAVAQEAADAAARLEERLKSRLDRRFRV